MNQLCVRFPCERADIGHNLGPEQRVSFELLLDKVTLITKDYLTERIEQAYIDQWKVLNKKRKVCISFKHACSLGAWLSFPLCRLFHWVVGLCSTCGLHQGSLGTNQEPRFQADQRSFVWYRWLFTPAQTRGASGLFKADPTALVWKLAHTGQVSCHLGQICWWDLQESVLMLTFPAYQSV